jgi:hypothetical protein
MKINFKDLHIGELIKSHADARKIEAERISSFLKCDEKSVENIYKSKSLDSELLLRLCKLLKYDFFRLYTQHLILYSPQTFTSGNKISENRTSQLPRFRKNIYTKEVISFVLEMMETGKKTKSEIITEYGIPKTTLYKWIAKHTGTDEDQ